jgi:methyl-accepting chemotaxis protein
MQIKLRLIDIRDNGVSGKNLTHFDLDQRTQSAIGAFANTVNTRRFEGTTVDLEHAWQEHIEWKIKLGCAISEQAVMDIATISSDNCCELGKWLHGEGKVKYGSTPSFADCVSTHAVFHKEAGKVATAINLRKFAKAETIMASRSFLYTSGAVAISIVRLMQDAAL